ncbi:Mg2+ and Co2+ transporter [Anaerolinea thermolimosa]|uniref:magnesium transporter CorA family protein n=1 Tax=Anaerolinea thermolimosa TaxID=229919 RepID=UPI000780F8FA|nr:magnesium transporter CorA family protein [Anaerolinea thermolimosa]GAP05927.1 Mg2+ and Co2+ transporter [Anaerolinea thermolimosa]
MITIYKNTETGLEVIPEVVTGCWINVIDPASSEIDELLEMGIPRDFITYSLDLDERSRTEREDDGTLLILLRIPYFQGVKTDIPYTTIPLGVVMSNRFVVTICRMQNDVTTELSSGRLKGLSTAKRNRFALRILLATANRYLAYLREINRIVDTLEDQITISQRNREILELLKYQKSLVYFNTAIKSNEVMMERLQRWQIFKAFPEDEDLLEDVITENQQAIEMVGISSNILSSMMDAFASIISNNLNVVMKFLTSITIVMSIPTIVTSYFGMNVHLPFEDHPLAALYVVLIFLAFSGIVIYLFMKRDWF